MGKEVEILPLSAFTHTFNPKEKRSPKLGSVKCRPPTTRRFYLTEFAVPLRLYIRHILRPRRRC
jgi:hypothetical protein